MKRVLILLLCLLTTGMCGCSRKESTTIFDKIAASPAAKMELPDGTARIVDGENALLRTLISFSLQPAAGEPADTADDWLYRITFNPAEKVSGAEEIVVSFHEQYVQIGEEFYVTPEDVPFQGVLNWAQSKFAYFA